MRPLVLALILASDGGVAAFASDGGVRDLYTLCPPADVPPATETDGGWLVPALRMERINCRLGACERWIEGRRAGAEPEPLVLPSKAAWYAIGVSVALTLVGGFYLGMKAEQAIHPAR